MKNLYLLPTDKPSKLFDCFGKLNIGDYITSREDLQVTNQHIYITSDEEIKEGDWVYHNSGYASMVLGFNLDAIKLTDAQRWSKDCKLVIMTTDTDLIADGVQPIDDEFLEWFVKNPSCESVEVEKRYSDFTVDPFVGYKIIIPQEEPKQDKWEQLRGAGLDKPLTSWDEIKKHVGLINDNIDEFDKAAQEYFERKSKFKQDLNGAMHEAHQTGRVMKQECTCGVCDNCEEQETTQILKEAKENALKQETLEEALDRKYPLTTLQHLQLNTAIRTGFEEGAKWQAERSYSEEQVIKLLIYCKDRFGGSGLEDYHHDDEVKEWFEQFKKD
jgi:hypothetical protein